MLNKVPRELLLLLKTNDLLRGIETCLETRNSSSSFIYMTKCCVKLINSYEREYLNNNNNNNNSTNRQQTLLLTKVNLLKFYILSYLRETTYLFKIFTYELFLYIFNI